MSHIVSIKTELRDAAAISSACRRLGLAEPVFGEAKLFSGAKTGWQVQLPNWRYPIVVDINTGQIDFDIYEGRWGEQKELNSFQQAYAVEKAKIEARKKGHTCIEQPLADGSINVTIQVGGAA